MRRSFWRNLCLFFTALFPLTALPASFLPIEAKLSPNDTGPAAIFGSAVALRGDTLIAGAVFDDEKGKDSGSVYVFGRTTTGWSLQQKLTASDGSANDHFGRAIAIHGNTLVIGASEADTTTASLAGAAYVFGWDGTHWNEQAKLVASGASTGQEFGNSVAVNGDTIVVGAPKDRTHGAASGAVYVFARNGTDWTPQAKLTIGPGSEGSGLGSSVSISGETLVAGAQGVLPQFSGHTPAAYIFTRAGTSWNQEAKLTDNPIATAFHSAFGGAVGISGDTIVVGDKFHDGLAADAGAVLVFTRSGTTWELQNKLTASDGSAGDLFGHSVAFDGDLLVVGAPWDADLGTATGSAYVFTRNGATWTQRQKLNASDAKAGDNFGSAVAASGSEVVIGAPLKDGTTGADFGAAYVFEPEPPPVVVVAATDPSPSEGGSTAGTFLIGRLGDKSRPLTVNFTLGGTAANGSDFQSIGDSAIIPADGSWVQVTVTAIDDSQVEISETVILTLIPNAAYTIGSPSSATINISDNDKPPPPPPPPTIAVNAIDMDAAESGPDAGAFIIDRFGDTASPLTVMFSLGGMAANGSDYQRLDNSVTIPAGSSSAVIPVQPMDDGEEEGPETVVLALVTSAGYTVGAQNSATIFIADNDELPPPPPPPPPARPTVTVIASDSQASEGNADSGIFTIQRSGDTGASLRVFFAPFHGEARNGRDFLAVADSITIPAGASSANAVVQPIDDTELEGPEILVLTLSSNTAYDVGSPSSATITIADSQHLAPTFPALGLETRLVVESSLPVAMSAGTLVVGGHVFVRSATAWVEQQNLSGGSAAALENDTLVIGSNAATVYLRNGSSWSIQQSLPVLPSSLALSGNTVVIGVRDDNERGTGAGAVYVFVRNGTTWSQQAKLTASDGVSGAALGYSVSISSDTLVAGAPGRTPDFAGQAPAVYVFVRNGTTWSQQAKLTGNPDETGPGHNFGVAVGISGETIVVGDPNDDGRGQDAGAAFVFARSGTSWTRQQIITASDGSTGDLFGWSIALKGDDLVVGSPRDTHDRGSNAGSAYVFGRDGTAWTQLQKLTASDGAAANNFGTPVAIDTDAVAIGSFGGLFNNSSNVPAVYVFEAAPNNAPTITCPSPATLSCSPASGMDATVSVQVGDPDGDGLTVTWQVDGTNAQTDSVPSSRPPRPASLTLARRFAIGSHPVRATVSDGRTSATCETVVTIASDKTPPVIQCPSDMVVAANPGQSSAMVQFKVLATDNCSGVTVVSNPSSGSAFSVGVTTVNCTATDVSGNQSTCSFKVTVQTTQPPDILTLRANPSVLWPPNGKMVSVTISVNAGENYVASSFRIRAVRKVELAKHPPSGVRKDSDDRGKGRARGGRDDEDDDDEDRNKGSSKDNKKHPSKDEEEADWQITGPLKLNLRAERSGDGGGRIYTITIEGQDRAGTRITQEVTVTVPLHAPSTKQREHKGDEGERSS